VDFAKWYHLLYINADIPIRNPPSKHQAKVAEVLDKIEMAKSGDMDPLLCIQPVSCIGDTEIVSYCRYLQYMITVLKDGGTKDDK
jgi:NaMN:DMB phosphoribosyltransferase